MPLVSVIIPTHNRPEFLQRAISSVLSQTVSDFEVIVVDDGDRESGAEDIVSSFNDSRIQYVPQLRPHSGAPVARNRGVEESHADLVAFLDDDDEWLPQKLERQLTLLSKEGDRVGFCFSAVVNVYDDREEKTEIEDGRGDFSGVALRRFNGFMTSTLIVRRDVFKEVGGFDESFPSHQEAELMIRLAERCEGVGISEALTRMSISQTRAHIGGDINRRIQGREMLFAKYRERYVARPRVLAQHYFWFAFIYRDAGKKEEALDALWRAWTLHHRLLYLSRYVAFRIFGR